jgi:hypothetical protein
MRKKSTLQLSQKIRVSRFVYHFADVSSQFGMRFEIQLKKYTTAAALYSPVCLISAN